MDQKKLIQQARVLKNKRISRRVEIQQNRPVIENGVVKYDRPVIQKPTEIRNYPSVPTVPSMAKPKKNAKTKIKTAKPAPAKKKGCSGCRRKIGKR